MRGLVLLLLLEIGLGLVIVREGRHDATPAGPGGAIVMDDGTPGPPPKP